MPLKLTKEEYIKKMGDFKLDRIWVKSFKFTNSLKEGSKQELTIEVVPFAHLENGAKVFYPDTVKKIIILDVEKYLEETGDTDLVNSYVCQEIAIAKLLNTRTDWTAEYEPIV
jgi:hypothetical protein